jgi:hypothetical protein
VTKVFTVVGSRLGLKLERAQQTLFYLRSLDLIFGDKKLKRVVLSPLWSGNPPLLLHLPRRTGAQRLVNLPKACGRENQKERSKKPFRSL